jgi:hypothetical protein
MQPGIHLNMYRRPAVVRADGAGRRGTVSGAGSVDDQLDEGLAPARIRRAVRALDLAPGLPMFIWHGASRRTRRAAALFADALMPAWTSLIMEVPGLNEPAFDPSAAMMAGPMTSHDLPERVMREVFFKAIIEDAGAVVAGGRAGMTRRIPRPRERIGALGSLNLSCITHARLMPFLYRTLAQGKEPRDWTLENLLDAGAAGRFGVAEGFRRHIPIGGPAARQVAPLPGPAVVPATS